VNIGERILQIAATETDFRCGRMTGQLARDAEVSLDSGMIAAVADSPCHAAIVAGSHCATHGVVCWLGAGPPAVLGGI
jgi:hypothetical protein